MPVTSITISLRIEGGDHAGTAARTLTGAGLRALLEHAITPHIVANPPDGAAPEWAPVVTPGAALNAVLDDVLTHVDSRVLRQLRQASSTPGGLAQALDARIAAASGLDALLPALPGEVADALEDADEAPAGPGGA